MARRKIVNKTGLVRISEVPQHNAWVGFVCLKCSFLNHVDIGLELISPDRAFENESWLCKQCGYKHSRLSNLPFKTWPKEFCSHKSIQAERFWMGFFRVYTETKESYWKQCNMCGLILPFNAFSKHKGWGPLERQMECRSCKGVINAELNPKRTKEQLHESSRKRRIADMLLAGEGKPIDHRRLFRRFGGLCFKTKKKLDIKKRKTWNIDHILPSRYLYPLTVENAALLSVDANQTKNDRWPSEFYTNSELVKLAEIVGSDLSLLASKKPIVNKKIDVDKCVSRFLKVREVSSLSKRIKELKELLDLHGLTDKLSNKNKRLLGYL